MKRKLLLLTVVFSTFFSVKYYAQGGTCATALPVTPGTFTAATLTGTASQPDGKVAGWYSFTPTSSGILSINSCGGGADTRLWIWTGSCSSLTAVANNDDGPTGCYSTGTSSYASRLDNVILLAGNTYYFEWDGVWDANTFTWSFTYNALPNNFDSEINSVTNRYTRIPLSQAQNGITLGATLKNLGGDPLTNVVLTAEVYELPNTTTPVATFSSAPINLNIGGVQTVVSGVWSPVLTASKSYQIKYIKTQTEVDQVSTNDVAQQSLVLDYNFLARDNGAYATAFNWANNSYSQGVNYTVTGPDQITGVQYYIASSSTTLPYTVQIFQVTNGVVGTTALYTSSSITNNGAGWKNHVLPTPLSVTAGEYLVAITKASTTSSFPVGLSTATFTNGKNLIKVGTGAWAAMESLGVNYAFMIRPKFGSDPTNDVIFVNNLNPGGEYTRIHSRQSLSGNDLVFSANGKNIGTQTTPGVSLTVSLTNSQGAVIYTATSALQDLTAGQTATFTVPNFMVSSYDSYLVDYVFNASTDQVPQNNTATTGFSRTKQTMSRTYGVTSSLGIGNNATAGVYDNGILGQTFTLSNNDFLDSVQFVLNSGTPANQPVRVDIYATDANGIPTGSPIGSTMTYTSTTADNTNGVVLKLPMVGGTLPLTAGTYFLGVIENAGNLRLATSSSYHTPNKAFLKWDANSQGATKWSTVESFNIFVSYVINPIFQACLPVQISENVTSASCGASDGAIDNTIIGGTGTYTYNWATNQMTEDINSLASGAYTITVKDVNECETSKTIVVPSLSNLSVTAASTDVNCANTSTGQIVLTAVNGVTPYNYAWSNNVVASDIASNLPAGAYSCTVTDATGCIVVVFDTLSELSHIELPIMQNPIVCSSTSTVDLTVLAQNGAGNYTYNWLNTSVNAATFQNATIGLYTCVATDVLGCTDTTTIVVNLSNLSANATANSLLCNGTNAGSVSVIVNGGLTPYAYDWSNSTSTSATLAGLSGGSYECIVTDASGCKDTVAAQVNEPTALAVTFAITDEAGGNDGGIDLTVSGATAPYTYSWSNNATSEDLTGLAGGNYSVTISDANGCTTVKSYTVNTTLGLNEFSVYDWTIYPNPGSTLVTISGTLNGQISILDVNGKLIVSSTITESNRTIDLSNLDRGSYFISLNGSVKRWVKQ